MNPPKLLFCDLETTGTDPSKHSAYQIGAIIVDPMSLDEIDRFEIKFRPAPGRVAAREALEKTRTSVKDLMGFMPHKEAHKIFTDWMSKYVDRYNKTDKFNFVAYNAPFDDNFLREFFNDCGDKFYGSWFWNPALCVMRQAAMEIRDSRASISNFKLGNICALAEIDFDESTAHDAMYDIEKTLELFKALT